MYFYIYIPIGMLLHTSKTLNTFMYMTIHMQVSLTLHMHKLATHCMPCINV